MVVWLLSWNNKITDLPTGGMPPVGHEAQNPNEFPDVRLHELCQVHQRHEIKDDNRYGNSHQVATVLQGAFGEALKLCNSISVGHGGITRLDCVAVKR